MSDWEYTGNVKKVLIERNSSDCTTPKPEPQWSSATTCIGFDKYELWVCTTGEEKIGNLLEKNSSDCGYTPPEAEIKYRWLAWDVFCDGNDLRLIDKKQKCTETSDCDCSDKSPCWEDVLDDNGELILRNGRIIEKDGCYEPPEENKFRWVEDGTICDNCNRYINLKQQKCTVKYDCQCLDTDPIDSECWEDTGKTKRGDLVKENDTTCEGCKETGTKYRWVSSSTECIGCAKWLVEKRQECEITDDCECSVDDPIDSECWKDMIYDNEQLITRTIQQLESNSADCCTPQGTKHRWIQFDTTCNYRDKYQLLKHQECEISEDCECSVDDPIDSECWRDVYVSVDGGDVLETTIGDLIEAESQDCTVCSFSIRTDAATVKFIYKTPTLELEIATKNVDYGKATLTEDDVQAFMKRLGLTEMTSVLAEPKRNGYSYIPERIVINCDEEVTYYGERE